MLADAENSENLTEVPTYEAVFVTLQSPKGSPALGFYDSARV